MNPIILNFGSINIDHVYRVPHFVRPGETLASIELKTGLGGKGANQSVAIARASGVVMHLGRVNKNDNWAPEIMQRAGVDISHIELVDNASGHAIIQVDNQGENAIVLHGGANQNFELESLEKALNTDAEIAFLLLQNECNLLADAFQAAIKMGIKLAFNPAPMSEEIKHLPLSQLDTLIVNQGEAEMLAGTSRINDIINQLSTQLPNTRIVITLGGNGATLIHNGEVNSVPAPTVEVVDTTGAGDTFVGYFLAGLVAGLSDLVSLERACLAASIAATRSGAIASIPTIEELTN